MPSNSGLSRGSTPPRINGPQVSGGASLPPIPTSGGGGNRSPTPAAPRSPLYRGAAGGTRGDNGGLQSPHTHARRGLQLVPSLLEDQPLPSPQHAQQQRLFSPQHAQRAQQQLFPPQQAAPFSQHAEQQQHHDSYEDGDADSPQSVELGLIRAFLPERPASEDGGENDGGGSGDAGGGNVGGNNGLPSDYRAP